MTAMENTRRLASGENGLPPIAVGQPVLVVDEEHAGHGRDEAREGEGGEHGADRVHPVGLGGPRVLPEGDQHAPGAAAADARCRMPMARARIGERERVEPLLGVDGDGAEEGGVVGEAASGHPREELGVQQPVEGRRRERQGDDGEREPAGPRRREPDDHGGGRPDQSTEEQRQPEVEARRLGDPAPGRAADGREGHLPEAHVAGPAGEEHERDGDGRDDRRVGGDGELPAGQQERAARRTAPATAP